MDNVRTVPIPKGATIGEPEVPIPPGATIGEPETPALPGSSTGGSMSKEPSLWQALYTATDPTFGLKIASAELQRLSDYLTQKRKSGEQAMVQAAAQGKPAPPSHTFSIGSLADTARILSGLLQPSTVAQLVAAGIIPEVMLPYFSFTGAKSALTPQQPGESAMQALQRRLLGASQAVGSATGIMSEPVRATAAEHFENVKELASKTAELPKGVARSLTGAGPEAIRQYEEQYNAKLEDARQRYNEKVQENLEKARKAHEEQNQNLRDQYIAKAREASKAREILDRRAALEKAKDRVSRQVMDDTKRLHQLVRSRLDARWDALRQKVGVNTPVDMKPVSEAVNKAITDDLRGEPENIALFNRVLQESSEEELPPEVEATIAKANKLLSMGMNKDAIISALRAQYPKGQVAQIAPLIGTVPGEPAPEMTFEGARIRYSALGDKMSSESLPGNVYRALARVRQALGSVIEKTADEKGAGAEYRKLLSDWRDYSYDWRGFKPGESGRKSVSMGGSPLYRLLNAEDPKTAAGILTGPAKERLIEQLKRYGGKANVGRFAALMSKIDNEIKSLPRVSGTSAEKPARPELKSFTPPEPKPFEPPRKLTPEEIRAEKVRESLRYLENRKMWELIIGLAELYRGNVIEPLALISVIEGMARLLSHPGVQKWIAKD